MGALVSVVVIELPEMDPETAARMDAICQEAFAALRADVGTMVDLANAARAAWERENARPGGRRRVVIQRVPRTEAVASTVSVRKSSSKTGRRSGFAKTWTKRRRSTPGERTVGAERRAAQRARLSDAEREANNRRQNELRHAAEAAMTAEQRQAKRAGRREADRARRAAQTPEERQARLEAERARSAARHAALAPEQVAARKARQAENYRRKKGTAK